MEVEQIFDNKLLKDKVFFKSSYNSKYIGSRENTELEFKETFGFNSLGQYAKTMASFSNNKGGYIVFGIANNPREIVGLKSNRFDEFDPGKFTEGINSLFSPALEWRKYIYSWEDESFGLVYTFEGQQKPVICTKNEGNKLKEGEIYFRYGGRSEKIKFEELEKIINDRINRVNESWKEHISRIDAVGPQNVAILDTLGGKIEGLGKTVLIDEKLLPKLKFIKKGQFNQKRGALTLKLVGELKTAPVSALKKQKVLVGEDIYVYRPSDVCKKVQNKIGKTFRYNSEHIKAWKLHAVRPSGKPKELPYKNEFCEYKTAESEYRYSQAWIDKLIKEYSHRKNYEKLQNLSISDIETK